jgi:ankyrin repeat protein
MGSSSGMNQQMQGLVKVFIDLIKKGDIDAVVQERSRNGIDLGSLFDEANFKQSLMFNVAHIPEDNQAVKMARVLKDMGVQTSQPDTLNQTPLYYAAREGKNQLIDFLIENGCNVNHIDTYGQTPIFYACREGRMDAIKQLVGYGADPDLVDNNGQTPMYYAIK